MPRDTFKFFIPWEPRKMAKGQGQRLRIFTDQDVPSVVAKLLREHYRLPTRTARSVGMDQAEDRAIFEFCRQKELVLVSFNVKDFWRMPLEQSFGMFLLDIPKDRYGDVQRAFAEFFRHNGVVGRRNYTAGMLKLTTRGYVMKYLFKNQTYQVEAQYRGTKLFAVT